MSVDLLNDNDDEFCFSNVGWRHLLAFAEKHGFVDDRPGEDRASAEDAQRLADTIERGMGGGSSAEIADRISRELTELLVTSGSPLFSTEPIRYDGRSIDHWRQFIAFARRGGFTVAY